MLLKVFKHDFKTCARYEIPFLFTLLGAVVFGFINMGLLSLYTSNRYNDSYEVFGALASLGMWLVIMAISVASSVMVLMLYYRFYKSMVTDEAYLTLTLPVSPSSLLVGKLLSALLWSVIAVAAVSLSATVLIVGGSLFFDYDVSKFFAIFDEAFDAILKLFGYDDSVLMIILVIINLIVNWVMGFLQIFFAILYSGARAKKHKILSAITVIFVTNFIMSFIETIIEVLTDVTSIEFASLTYSTASIVALLLSIVIRGTFAVLFFWFSRNTIRNKINLE